MLTKKRKRLSTGHFGTIKKLLFISAIGLTTVSYSTSCSSDDDGYIIGRKVETDSILYGVVDYDDEVNRWYIGNSLMGSIDGRNMYFPNRMPNVFKKEGMEVKFSGDTYELHLEDFSYYGGLKTYHINLKYIEEAK